MDDLISRSELIEQLEAFKISIGDVIMGFVVDRIIERVKNMPAAEWNRQTTISVNFYDKEEIYPNCTVQVLTNTVTGDVSVGWWKNGGTEDGK